MGVMSSRTSVDRFCGDEGILISPDFTPPTTTDLAAACAKRLVQSSFTPVSFEFRPDGTEERLL